ncbi:uncharacterized protein LOC117915588 [Vitis riparia]|uniref:uncharacterized protein LOC117915588 n=1 Tax=Vitis riparia TaxID=96939 RepID=UPI00155AC61A|nr:uncharacterized protein LOC117915588 [Vitis riparia]
MEMPEAEPPPEIRENRHPLPPEIQESDIEEIYNAIEYILDQDQEVLAQMFTCTNCHTDLASLNDFIEDIDPLDDSPVRSLLFNNVMNVNFGGVQHRVSTHLHQTEVDVSHIHCNSCQSFVGWKIVRTYGTLPPVRTYRSIPSYKLFYLHTLASFNLRDMMNIRYRFTGMESTQ